MQLPQRVDLPFFAYGAFRPGQLAFHRLKPFVERAEDSTVSGELRIRDGLPILDPDGIQNVSGSVLFFRSFAFEDAYRSIVDLEPDAQYRWGEKPSGSNTVNVLFGRSPKKGSVPGQDWDGRQDPLFTAALDVVRDTLSRNKNFDSNLKRTFRLQMAYLLLWSAIERYVSLRYHLGNKVMEKVMNLASESAFSEALRNLQPAPREVYRADKPQEQVRLDSGDPEGSLSYYYQIRSNIVHRGKGHRDDHGRVRQSLEELLVIFDQVLNRAFDEARLDV